MAPGTPITVRNSTELKTLRRSVGIVNFWDVAVTAGGPAVQDAATITNPTAQIGSAKIPINTLRGGSHVIVRLGYDDALSTITNPTIKVFGRTGTDVWQILRNRAGNIAVAIPTAPSTDVTDGTLLYTTPEFSALAWELLGCEQIVIGVQIALAGTGVVNNSIIQAKII